MSAKIKIRFRPNRNIDGSGGITNQKRADWAHLALDVFHQTCMASRDAINEEDVRDLICDIGHWCDEQGIDFNQQVEIALRTWGDER